MHKFISLLFVCVMFVLEKIKEFCGFGFSFSAIAHDHLSFFLHHIEFYVCRIIYKSLYVMYIYYYKALVINYINTKMSYIYYYYFNMVFMASFWKLFI